MAGNTGEYLIKHMGGLCIARKEHALLIRFVVYFMAVGEGLPHQAEVHAFLVQLANALDMAGLIFHGHQAVFPVAAYHVLFLQLAHGIELVPVMFKLLGNEKSATYIFGVLPSRSLRAGKGLPGLPGFPARQ